MPHIPGALRSARMAGSSIAAPPAGAWVTDFLNAAYYARADDERDVRDLRLAQGILTTYWHGITGRIGARHLLAFNRAFGRTRVRSRGRLDHDALLAGAEHLLGEWFAEAWHDTRRRAHGIAFKSVEARAAFDPADRLRHAALKQLTAPRRSPAEQQWATYDPVSLPDAAAAMGFLTAPERWPDMGCANGRFTAVRPGGLSGQTFEIEVVAEPAPRAAVFTRGYVSCTELHAEEGELQDAVSDLRERYVQGAGIDAAPILPAGARPLALVVLTTHEGHFMGRAISHLLVWQDAGGAWIRDVGCWDPMPAHLAAAYNAVGRKAQHEFWGPSPPSRSMLAQLAEVTA